MRPAMVVHGGVGTPSSEKDGCERALEKGLALLEKGGNALEASVEAAIHLEEDERYNAGFGSNIRLDGVTIEMDAALMTDDGRIGAVAAVQKIKNPILLALEVWKSPHVLLSGEGAYLFGLQRGLEIREEVALTSQLKFEKLQQGIRKGKLAEHPLWKNYNWKDFWNYPTSIEELWGSTDTIGVVARDERGNFAASLSTGGAGTMMKGRVGDTPLPGSGFYAGKKGAVVATGLGELIIEKLLSFRVYQEMEKGKNPQEACDWGVSLYEKEVPIGLLAIDAESYGASNNWDMAWSGREINSHWKK